MILWATVTKQVELGFLCQGFKFIFTQSEASTVGSLKNTLQPLCDLCYDDRGNELTVILYYLVFIITPKQ